MVHAIGAFGHGKEGLAVISFHPHHQHIHVPPLDGAAVQRGMHADALHQIGIALPVKIIAPRQRGMVGREDGMLPTLVNAVALDRDILFLNEPAMVLPEPGQAFFIVHKL